jgi:hypothetical protein
MWPLEDKYCIFENGTDYSSHVLVLLLNHQSTQFSSKGIRTEEFKNDVMSRFWNLHDVEGTRDCTSNHSHVALVPGAIHPFMRPKITWPWFQYSEFSISSRGDFTVIQKYCALLYAFGGVQ